MSLSSVGVGVGNSVKFQLIHAEGATGPVGTLELHRGHITRRNRSTATPERISGHKFRVAPIKGVQGHGVANPVTACLVCSQGVEVDSIAVGTLQRQIYIALVTTAAIRVELSKLQHNYCSHCCQTAE